MGPKKRPKVAERPKLSTWNWRTTPSKAPAARGTPESDDDIQVLDAWPSADASQRAGPSKRPRTTSASPPSIKPDVWEEDGTEGMGMETDEDVVELETMGGLDACPLCGASLRSMSTDIAEQHVNACLDSPRPSPKPPAQKERTPRPISSMSHSLTLEPRPSPSPAPDKPNAFSVLMSSHKEKEQWKEGESAELRDANGRRNGPRKAPFYKVLTGMPIAVDAFCYGAIPGVTAYFLTHAHSDHYTNLTGRWRHGPIYCSQTTANLIVHMLGVERQWVHALPDDEEYEIPNTGGVKVTNIEANHCPGSSVFLFEGPQTIHSGDSSFKSPYVGSKRTFRYLHCGDFRACPKHVLHPAVARDKVDTVYLDTTYLNPQYCFPPQPLVIEACAALAKKVVFGENVDVKPDVDSDEDIKPDLGDTIDGIEDDPNADAADVKPDIDDIKPDTKPDVKDHPAAQAFELQERSVAMMEGWLVKKEANGDVKPASERKGRTLVLIGTYSIGKERIVKGIAQALGSKIYCDQRKRSILDCEADSELHAMLDTDPTKCQVHLVPLMNISLERLQPYLQALKPHFDRVLAFRPTGWTYTPPAGADTLPDINFVIKRDQGRGFSDVSLKPIRGSSRQFMMFGVPYSEHSSFFELTCFALSLPGPDLRVIATVNVHNEKSRLKMKKWIEKWAAEKAKRKERGLSAVVDYRDETYW
ncbi:DNA cross-link repair protein PSO2/SNM1 [Vanrija albida]|uniref:DNA cross-link repair protein PSO2/SNM1 n=1 Tax=Vanrija albida TaxID=181172 RepID=A0ABR3QBI6_9TREE